MILRYSFLFFIFFLFGSNLSAQKLNKTQADRLITEAKMALHEGQVDKALSDIGTVLKAYVPKQKVDTTIANAHFVKGDILNEQENYPAALNEFEKALQICSAVLPQNHKKVGEIYFGLGRTRYYDQKWKEAIDYLSKGIDIVRQASGPLNSQLAKPYYIVGYCFFQLKENDKGISYFKLAKNCLDANQGQDQSLLASVSNAIGSYYYDKIEHDSALYYFNEALSIQKNIKPGDDLSHAIYYGNIGQSNFYLGRYAEGIRNINEQIRLIKKFEGPISPKLVLSYDFLAKIYEAQNRFEEAIDIAKSSVQITEAQTKDDPRSKSIVYERLANLYSSNVQHKRALTYYLLTLEEKKEIFNENSSEIGASYSGIGNAYTELNDYDKAESFLLKAIEIERAQARPNPAKLIRYHQRISTTYSRKEDFAKSIQYQKRAFEFLEIPYPGFNRDAAGASLNMLLGVTYGKTQEYQLSITHLLEGINWYEKFLSHNNRTMGVFYSAVAITYGYLGQMDKAENYLQKSLDALREMNQENDPYVSSIVYSAATLKLKQKDFSTALNYIESAIASYNGLNHIYDASLQSGYDFQDQAQSIFELGIKIILEGNKQSPQIYPLEKAFAYSERSKNMLMLKAMKSTKPREFARVPNALLEEERRLLLEINELEKQKNIIDERNMDNTAPALVSLNEGIVKANDQLDLIRKEIKERYLNYYRSQTRHQVPVTSISEIQQSMLSPGESMLEYFQGDSSLFIFLVQPQHFEVREVNLGASFPLKKLVTQMTNDGIYARHNSNSGKQWDVRGDEPENNFAFAAYELYKQLIQPFEEKIKNSTRLIIIPDGSLNKVPFEALLVDKAPRVGAFQTYDFLVNHHNISYCPSSTILKEMETQQNTPSGKKGLAMAPFYNHSTKLPSFSLEPLKYSKAELEGISGFFDFDLKVGKEATIEFFKRSAQNYAILHLSTHASFDETDRDFSYLAFFPDQLLLVRDLYAMNLNSQMAVLSACESGLGYYQKGEGLYSLTSALTYAGVKSIFSTLWEVPDDSTKDLMLLFYEELANGKSKDVALTESKRRYIQKVGKANPYFWASFIGIGDMSPLK